MRAPADGYTLLLINSANAINASLYGNLNFDFVRDITPVASIARTPDVMEVNPSFPAKTVPEFIAYAKANPGKINMAVPGIGTAPHIAGELFKMMASVDMVNIPYNGSPPALTALIGGQVQFMFDPLSDSSGYIRAGALRPLAVTTATRLDTLPDIPALGEFLPGYEAVGWQGIGAPRSTPAEIIDKLNTEINAALADLNISSRITDLGSTVFISSPAEFSKFVVAETKKWGNVVKFSGAKAQ